MLLLALLALVRAYAADLAFTEADGSVRLRMSASLGDFEGRAAAFRGRLSLGAASADAGVGELIVPVRSLTTGLGPRDSRMHTWCLDAATFPEIRFVVREARGLRAGEGGGAGTLRGDLTVRDVTRAVDVPVTWAWEGPNLHLEGEYAMDWSLWNVPDPTVVLSTMEPEMRVAFDVVAKP